MSQLSLMPRLHQLAFANSVATRQICNWEWYARRFDLQRVSTLREKVKNLWDEIQKDSMDIHRWTKTLAETEEWFPQEDDNWAVCHALADDALGSFAYSLRLLLNNDPQEGVWAARRAYDAADQVAIRLLDLQPGLPESEQKFLTHPIVQRELSHQVADLLALRGEKSQDRIFEVRIRAFDSPLLTSAEQNLQPLQQWF